MTRIIQMETSKSWLAMPSSSTKNTSKLSALTPFLFVTQLFILVFSENTLANDIALIKLSRTLDVNEKVKPVPLPDPGSSPQGTCEVAGWGQFSVSESSNKTVLQEVPVPIMDPSGCKAKTDRKISEHEMCVGAEADKNHTCIGDSGGPLYNQNGGKAVVIGIASSGVGCNNGGKPAVYMKLSAYTDWIKSTMGSNAGPARKFLEGIAS